MKKILGLSFALACVAGCTSSANNTETIDAPNFQHPEPETHGDPQAPGVSGTLSVPTSIDTSGYSFVVVQVFPDGDGTFDPSDPMRDVPVGEFNYQMHFPIPNASIPLNFALGGDAIGTSASKQWRVFAWLSTVTSDTAPAANAPTGTSLFQLPYPWHEGGHGMAENVTVTLETNGP